MLSPLPVSALAMTLLFAVSSRAAPTTATVVNLTDFGAKGNGESDDTAAIGRALTATCATGAELHVPTGTYRIVPATKQIDEAGTTTVALLMCSNMHVRADPGSVFKMADGVSTDATPKRFAMFFSNQVLHDISIRGLTFDMNGAMNPISPRRSSFIYNHYTQAAIIFSGTPNGVAAGASDVVIENCRFLNTAGVSSIVMAQSNALAVVLGKRWTIRNNRFWNNGIDTDDHSSVFGWADDVVVEGNTFGADTMFATNGTTGCNVAYEIHGANTRFAQNRVSNCFQGVWVGSNYTTAVTNILIQSNVFAPLRGVGIDFYRMSERERPVTKVVIDANTFQFTDDMVLRNGTGIPVPGFLKAAAQIAAAYSVTDVMITNNKASKDGANVASAMVVITPQSPPRQTHDSIVVRGNTARGMTFGVFVKTNAKNGLGHIDIRDNLFIDLSPSSVFAVPQGISTSGPGTIESLTLTGNAVVDTRPVPLCKYGVRLSGSIATLSLGPQRYEGMATANYMEAGLTVRSRTSIDSTKTK